MTHSESINELAGALAKAQAVMAGAKKDADNPFFKSRYADLASVWDACRKALADNGLSIVQTPNTDGDRVAVTTLLLHSSGQWVTDTLVMTPKDDGPQAFGSAITYARRYALAAFVGVAPEDDDGEAAQGRIKGQVVTKPIKVPASDGPLCVAQAKKTPTSRKGTDRYVVELSDGRRGSTIKEALGTLAMQLSETGEVVAVVIEDGKYGPELIELKRLSSPSTPEPIPVPAVSADDIPF